MTEWGVVGVIIALVGLGAAIIKPIVSLTRAITTLTCTVDNLRRDVEGISVKNTASHARLWEHNEEQDKTLQNHEGRITRLETRGE